MDESDFYEMKGASKAIAEIGIGDGSVITLLIDLIDNPDHETRRELFKLFEHFAADSQSALPLFIARLESGAETIPDNREALRKAIRAIESQPEQNPNVNETIPGGGSDE